MSRNTSQLSFTVYGAAVGKPHMTHADRWKKRPCVVQYWSWCDAVRKAARITGKVALIAPTSLNITIYLPMPKSWSRREKLEAMGCPHMQRPDADNILKGISDALTTNDAYIHKMSAAKYWDDGHGARVEVRLT